MDPSRRYLLQLLASAAVAARTRETADAQTVPGVRTEDLRGAFALRGEALTDDRLEIVRRATHQALAEIAPIRALDLDDDVGPAMIFSPARHGG